MTGAAAAWGLDLHLDVAGPRVRAGVEAALRDAVRSGRLVPGSRLPSSRALAADLGVARNTVADAYGQLVAEGWLASRRGSGTWVAGQAGRARPPGAQAEPAGARDAAPRTVRYDLRAGSPDLSAFPRLGWLSAARRALNAAPSQLLGYTDPRGLPELRSALAGYLARARGVAAAPDRIVICSGVTQALELLYLVLRGRGTPALATEAFGYPRYRQLSAMHGLRVSTLPVDQDGAVVDGLGGEGAVLLTPAHQFPIGVQMGPERRRRVIDWAARADALIIEDDYDGELRYDRPAVGALQALSPERVAYAGTASKSLAPGLRLGWLVLPARLTSDAFEIKSQAGWLTSSMDQLTLAEFIASGAYDRQLRRMRLAYRRRRDRLLAALAREAPRVRVTGIAAGLHALLRLPPGQREADLVARAAESGLAIEGLGDYAAGGQEHDPALVIGYATPPGHAYTTALARLCAVLREGHP